MRPFVCAAVVSVLVWQPLALRADSEVVSMQRADLDCILDRLEKVPGWDGSAKAVRRQLGNEPPDTVELVDAVWLEEANKAIEAAKLRP
jgi:hypothetical protein